MHYEPPEKALPADVGDFPVAAVGLDHGHIFDMLQKLRQAGARLKWAFGYEPGQAEKALTLFPEMRAARCEAEALDDPEIRLVVSAAVPSERCALGLRAMDAGKDFFADKAPLTTLSQLEAAREKAAKTGRKYACCYSERVCSEAATLCDALLLQGAIGELVQVIGLGPHRLAASTRPKWFFDRDLGGGILVDIGSHQAEQFLHYAGTDEAAVTQAEARNVALSQHPRFHDFGQMNLRAKNGVSGHFRVDWMTPDGLPAWGDGRVLLLGTKGYIEMRKVVDIPGGGGEILYLADGEGVHRFECAGRFGLPFFPALLRDCVHRTEEAMTQAHTFASIELALRAQQIGEAGA